MSPGKAMILLMYFSSGLLGGLKGKKAEKINLIQLGIYMVRLYLIHCD